MTAAPGEADAAEKPRAAGLRSNVYRWELSAERVSEFADAVGYPLARAAALGLPPLPPTIWTCCRAGEFELFGLLGLPLARVLHAEQSYDLQAEGGAPSTLEYQTTVTRLTTKRGQSGVLNFVELETPIGPVGGPIWVQARTTIVVRGEIGYA